jgi:hypothetical protein
VGDLLQPTRSDAVGALLVFLHLLEGETEPIGQLLLAHQPKFFKLIFLAPAIAQDNALLANNANLNI